MKVIINLNYNLLQQMNMICIFLESCQKLVYGEPHWDGVSKLLAVKESSLGLMF